MDQMKDSPKDAACRGELLIVDDSASALAYLSSLLLQAGYQVREAPSGELALMTLSVRVPELILLDVRMPEMDGFEVCRRIKENPATRDVAVIFLSAQDDSTDKVLGLKVGAVDFIGKSFSPEEMLARIDTHITLARVKKELEQERVHLEDRVRERTGALLQGRQLLATVIDSGPDWIYATDLSHQFLLVNRNMASALGYAHPGDLIGQYDCVVFPHDDCLKSVTDRTCALHDDEQKVFAGATVYRPQEKITLAGGHDVFFETYKSPLQDLNGNIYGVLCYRRDITQRLKMEEENRTLERALWQAKKMEAVGQLSGGIAHDFNHLLSLILGYAQFAQTALTSGKTDKLEGYIGEIFKAGTEGQAVVAQLLAFSRNEETPSTAIDVGPLVAEVAETLREVLGKDYALNVQIEPDLPVVLGKPTQIKQIVSNLFLNARDALESNQGNINIRLFQEHIPTPHSCASCHKSFRGHYLALSVGDSGRGIPPHLMGRIFDPFVTTKDVGKGSGLGLSMVHGIVHSLGGHIEVESSLNGGTDVFVRIPVTPHD